MWRQEGSQEGSLEVEAVERRKRWTPRVLSDFFKAKVGLMSQMRSTRT